MRGDDVRLRNRLAVVDGQRAIVVGQIAEAFRPKLMARDFADCRQDARRW